MHEVRLRALEGGILAQKALKVSQTETKRLLGGIEESNIYPNEG